MDDSERIILDVNGKEIEMLDTIRTHFKEKHGVELSNGALLRDLMDIEYIRITEDRHSMKKTTAGECHQSFLSLLNS